MGIGMCKNLSMVVVRMGGGSDKEEDTGKGFV